MTEAFEALRGLLFGIAYRMTGSVRDAEDIVQEAYVRYQAVPADQIHALKPFLTTVVTRLAIDHLKAARQQREVYFGPWLPEPLLTDAAPETPALTTLNESLSMAFLVLLEKLSPVERAVFLLREIFDYNYPTIAAILGKQESACRQILHRARTALQTEKLRYHSSAEEHRRLFGHFLQACAEGDLSALERLLASDVVAVSDGGGKASAATRPISGAQAVRAFILGLFKRMPPGCQIEIMAVNGRQGIVVRENDRPVVVVTVDVADERITRLWFMRNPDKLRGIHTPGG